MQRSLGGARSLRALSILLAVAVFGATFAFVRWWDFTLPSLGRQTYQAVFLSNGQTYFGRFYDRIGPYVKIVDPFYIQQTADPNDPSAAPRSRVVRRGAELHAPQNQMLVPRTSLLFVEDLAPGSPISQLMAGGAP